MQKLLSLIIVALVLYNIAKLKISSDDNNATIIEQASVNNSANNENQVSINNDPPVSLNGNLFERTISKIVINALKTEEGKAFFENILQPLNKPIDTKDYTIPVHKDLITSLFKINTIGTGNVGPASCGHVVTVFYQISDMSNNLISEDTKTFTIGSGAVMLGLDNVIVGMNVGQAREAIIPAKYAASVGANNDNTDSAYRVNVMLKSILPQNFINSNEVKIYDNEIAYRIPLLCGEKIAFNAKITRLANGEVLYDSKAKGQKVDMKIGDITYPLIFSYALQGKVPVGTRTVIAKGQTFKALGSNINKIISQESLPLNEYLMLEINDFK
ncbi:MAG TPA: FKBP-type peptidyl-prolyl cis-trans isomerase [Rickettsia endosymbiont of Bembidion lapponicum]|nr:FKBP-type peptidyl-prolyl cis-trans isomerase [Rickettsia endosymbiont of Bembidion lapponicum]